MVWLYIISSPGFTILFICSFARDQLIEGGWGGGGLRGGGTMHARHTEWKNAGFTSGIAAAMNVEIYRQEL